MLALFVSLSPCVVRAQHAERTAQARRLYNSGQRAFERSQYTQARAYFEQSYALSERPELLYNIGRAAEEAGDNAGALSAYQRYLASERDEGAAARREEVQARVTVLTTPSTSPNTTIPANSEATLQATTDTQQQATNVPAVAVVDTVQQNHDVTEEGWFWPVVLGGAALIAGGVVLTVVLTSTGTAPITGDDGMTHIALVEF